MRSAGNHERQDRGLLTCTGLMPSPMSSVRGSRARNACISPRIDVPVNPANNANASKSYGIRCKVK